MLALGGTTIDDNAAADMAAVDHEKAGRGFERARWVVDAPKPPGLRRQLKDSIRRTAVSKVNGLRRLKEQPGFKIVGSFLQTIFPIMVCFRNYNLIKFRKDLMAGLTVASLCIPQSIAYAALAKVDPQYGLYTSVVPPLVYAFMGSSRDVAIGPVAVVSLVLSSMLQKVQDPVANPIAYRSLVFTATFFAGIFQAAFGVFRLGFLVDFLSHAAIVGFMAGAAIVIGLQQMKGLLGVTYSTNKTDVVSVVGGLWRSVHHPWSPHNVSIGCSFLAFILVIRFVGRKHKRLFWLSAIAPLLSVILSTAIVYLTRADKHGVKIVKRIKGGFNPLSAHQLQFNSRHTLEATKIGLVVAVIALTEAIAVGRSFAAVKGYHLNGNKEMVAMGFMNIAGSLSSCYVATGSFSRTAVNFSAGCETTVSNIVMAITVAISLELLTKLLYYTPTAINASIVLSALPGLIDLHEARKIWRLDKLDFLACAGAFFGVLFVSVKIGLLVAVTISFAKIILNSIQPGIEELGRLPGTDIFAEVNQYPMATEITGLLIIRVHSPFLCFANANIVRERIIRLVTEKEEDGGKGNGRERTQLLILDMSNLMNIDTTGISSLEELHTDLVSLGIQLAVTNPRWQVIHKLRMTKLVSKMGRRVFLTVDEAVETLFSNKSNRAAI